MPDLKTESPVGPLVLKLQEAAGQTDRFETTATIEFDSLQPMVMRVTAAATSTPKPNSLLDIYKSSVYCYTGLVGDGLKIMSDFCRDVGTRNKTEVRLACDSIVVKSKGGALSAAELKRLAVEAWCEVFGVPAPSHGDLKKAASARKDAQSELRMQLLDGLRSGPEGVKGWTEKAEERRALKHNFNKSNMQEAHLSDWIMQDDFQSSNFNNAVLLGAKFHWSDLSGCTFQGARMDRVYALDSKLARCDFTGASLVDSRLKDSSFAKSNFSNVDFTNATLSACDMRGADLSATNLGCVSHFNVKYDEETKWPLDFIPTDKHYLEWRGTGKNPLRLREAEAHAPQGAIDFDTFVASLQKSCDKDRLKKVFKMLKAESYQLYAEVQPDAVNGIVKSQTDADLFYSCQLTADGKYSCCTQNLNICGGLRGALCKHLLVLVIGLTKAGELGAETACKWVVQSQAQDQELDRDVATATFLRYRGVETGDIDWRPTETIPEDYYTY